MSLAFYHMIDKLGRLVTSIRKNGKGTQNAASPPSINPPLHTNISLHLPASEVSVRNWVRKITFRVVDGLPYGLIVGADYLKKRRKHTRFQTRQRLSAQPERTLDTSFRPHITTSNRGKSNRLTCTDCLRCDPQDSPIARGYGVGGRQHLSNNDISTVGCVSKVSGGYAVGSMPQDKQLVIVLPQETYDLGKTAVVGVARGLIWWKPGIPVTYKLVSRCNEPAKISNLTPITHIIPLNQHEGCASVLIAVRWIFVDD